MGFPPVLLPLPLPNPPLTPPPYTPSRAPVRENGEKRRGFYALFSPGLSSRHKQHLAHSAPKWPPTRGAAGGSAFVRPPPFIYTGFTPRPRPHVPDTQRLHSHSGGAQAAPRGAGGLQLPDGRNMLTGEPQSKIIATPLTALRNFPELSPLLSQLVESMRSGPCSCVRRG